MIKKTTRMLVFWLVALAILFYAIRQFPDRSQEAATAYTSGEYSKAARFWRKLARQGNVEAQYNLGAVYAAGQGVPRDPGRAFKWFLLAAEQGNRAAQFEVGKSYELGLGVTPSMAVGLLWIGESAAQEYLPAQIDLGLRYLYGTGVEQDQTKSKYWFSQASGAGNPPPVLISRPNDAPRVKQ